MVNVHVGPKGNQLKGQNRLWGNYLTEKRSLACKEADWSDRRLKAPGRRALVVKKAFGGFLEHSLRYDSSQYGLDRFRNDYLHLRV
jgi:hypothetical protein